MKKITKEVIFFLSVFFIWALFFPVPSPVLAFENSFDYVYGVNYEPIAKLVNFLNDKKRELENIGDSFEKTEIVKRRPIDVSAKNGAKKTLLLSAVLNPIKDTVVGKPKQYAEKVFCVAKDFIFPGACRGVSGATVPEKNSREELSALKKQYDDAIFSANELNQKFNTLQKELGKVKAGGVIVKEPIIEQKTVERTIEKIVSGLSQDDLSAGIALIKTELNNLNTNLTNQINNLSSNTSRQSTAAFQAISLTNRIDSLSGTRLSGITVSGVSGLTDSDIPDGITASNYLPLTGGTIAGDLTITGNATLGVITLQNATAGYFTATSTTQASTFPYASTTALTVSGSSWFNGLSTMANLLLSGSTTLQNFTANNSTTTNATTTNLAVSGNVTIGNLNGPLQSNNGLVSATTSVGYQYGGTGLTATPSFGQILRGTGSGYALVATSTLGINTDDLIEGANLFWTNTRFDNRLSSTTTLPNLTTLANLSITGSQVSNLNTLWDNRMSATTSLQNMTTLANLATVGTITSGTWNGTTISTQYGGTGQNFSASSGLMNLYSGTASAIATSSIGLLTTDVAEGTNQYWTNTRFDNRLSATTSLQNITTLANLATVGTITSGTWNGTTITVNKGGTGLSSYTLGDVLYASGTGTLAGTSTPNLKATLALNNVENTALSTWAGSTNITTLGTIGTGVWNGTTIAVNKGGTGQTSFGQGWLNSDGTTISASTSPTVNYIVATSTAKNSTFAGRVGIGTTAPEYKLQVGNIGGGLGTGNAAVEGAFFVGEPNSQKTIYLYNDGTILKLDAYDYGASVPLPVTIGGNGGNVLLAPSGGGNAGIGTTTPNWKLSVAGIGSFDDYVRASYFTATSTTASTFPYASTTALTASGTGYFGAISNTGGYTQSGTSANTFTGTPTFSNATYSALFTGGNVGIGTTTPSSSLVVQAGGAAGFVLDRNVVNGAEWMRFDNTSVPRGYVGYDTGTGGALLSGSLSNSFIVRAENALHLVSNGGPATNGITVATNGSVGVGTTSPSTQLHISNTGSPTLMVDSTSSSGTRQARLKLNVNNNGSSDPAGAISFNATDIEQARIDSLTSSGGITDGILRFFTRKSGTVTEQVRIDNNGNVGIGTTSPWRTLSVTGTVGFDGLTGATGSGSLCLDSNKQVVYNSGSDACLSSTRATKHDIQILNLDGLSLINSLQPSSFIYNQGDGRTRYGFMAEDTALVDDRLATHNEKGEITGIDDRAILSVVVKAVKEMNLKLSDLQASVALSGGQTTDSLFSWILSKFSAIGIMFGQDKLGAKKGVFESFEMKDATTGEDYCVKIRNGEWEKTKGTCGETGLSASASAQASTTSSGETSSTLPVGDTSANISTSTTEEASSTPSSTVESISTETSSSSPLVVEPISTEIPTTSSSVVDPIPTESSSSPSVIVE